MSEGSGITPSEFNASDTEPIHLYPIWIQTRSVGLEPSYAQLHCPEAEKLDRLRLLAAGDGRQDSLLIKTDINLYTALLSDGSRVVHSVRRGKGAWIQILSGSVSVNDIHLETVDGASVSDEENLVFTATTDSE